ncbi:MAG: ribbon-helix-helix domain-containing protein [Patescibacteria group bacterium]
MQSKTRISITINPVINEMLDNLTETSGVSKSSLIEHAIKDLLNTQLEKDAKALSKIKFDDLPSEDEWLAIMPKND